MPTTKTITPRPIASSEMTRVTRAISCCSGLGSSLTAWVRLAMRPNWVIMPVSNTTARPVPETTDVPAKTRLGRSTSVRPSRSEASAILRAGIGFAGEGGIVGAQAVLFHHARIGGDVVAFGQHQHIAGHDLGGGDFDFLAAADHARVRRQQVLRASSWPARRDIPARTKRRH